MNKSRLLGAVCTLMCLSLSSVSASTIGQWAGSSRSWNSFDFSSISTTLTNAGHIIEADGAITAANLSNDDMFLIGEATVALTAAELSALSTWVAAGGILWMGVDSGSNEAISNSILVGLGSTLSFTAANSGSGSPLASGNFATDNIFNIVGQSLNLSLGRSTVLGGGGTYLSNDILAYEQIGSGFIFAAGDRFEQDFSSPSASNTNGQLILNIAAGPNPVPVPAAVWLFSSGLLGLIGVARRRKAA